MAEITIENLQALRDAGQITAETYEQMAGAIRSATDSMGNLAESAGRSSSALGQYIEQNKTLSATMSAAYDSLNRVVQSASKELTTSSSKTKDNLIQTATIAGTIMFPQLTRGIKGFEGFGNAGLDSSQRVTTAFEKLVPMMDKVNIPKWLQEGVKEMFRMQEASQELKVGIFNMLQASGSVAPIMESGALSIDALNQSAASMSERMREIEKATGMNSAALPELIAKFSQMPGVLDMVSKGGVSSADSIDSLVKTVTLARGIGISYMSVIDRQAAAMFNWGTSIDKTMDNLTLMNKTTQELGMNRDVMLKFLDDATSGTNKLGDSTDSAIIMMGTLGKAMKEAGVSGRGIGEILAGTAGRMRNLDMGQAAFINQQAGGKGGLAGAFEIELMKQQGDIAGITQKAMDAFSNMGMGGPVTLQDVKENDALAGELMKQTEILKKLGLAGDNQEAYRMLEAMQGGALDDLKDALKDPMAAEAEARKRMTEVMESGNVIQQTGNDLIMNLTNSLDDLARTNALNIDAGIQQIDRAAGSEKSRGAVGPITGITGTTTTDARTGEDMGSQLQQSTRQSLTADTYGRVGDVANQGMNEFMDGLRSLMQSIPEDQRQSGAFQMMDKLLSPVKSSREAAVEGVAEASKASAGMGMGSQQHISLDGKATFEVILTDEERNVIVSRDFVKRLDELAKRKAVQGGANPFSGAPNQ